MSGTPEVWAEASKPGEINYERLAAQAGLPPEDYADVADVPDVSGGVIETTREALEAEPQEPLAVGSDEVEVDEPDEPEAAASPEAEPIRAGSRSHKFEWERSLIHYMNRDTYPEEFRRTIDAMEAMRAGLALSSFADRYGRNARPGGPRLGHLLGLSAKAARRWVDKLEELGWVKCAYRGGSGPNDASHYELVIPAGRRYSDLPY